MDQGRNRWGINALAMGFLSFIPSGIEAGTGDLTTFRKIY